MSTPIPIYDTMGAKRIPHRKRPCITPCTCKLDSKSKCCSKGYCPCRKAGVYCGELCQCVEEKCYNSYTRDESEKDEDDTKQVILSEEDMELCEKMFKEEGFLFDTQFVMD